MATKAQKIRLALFFLVSIGILLGFLLLLAGARYLEHRDQYSVEFKDMPVGGLSIGAQVKYMGFRVGQVEEIKISRDDVSSVLVAISVNPELLPNAIRSDTRASMASQGITGLKYIELIAGSQTAAVLPPGSRIQTSESFLSTIDERAEVLTTKVEQVLNNLILLTSERNTAQASEALQGVSRLLESVNTIAEENRVPLQATVTNLEQTTRSLAAAATALQATAEDLHRIVGGKEVQGTLTNLQATSLQLRQQMEKPVPAFIANLNQMTTNIDRTFTHIDQTVVQSRDNVLRAMQDLQETLQNVRQTTDLIRENPSVLIRGRGDE